MISPVSIDTQRLLIPKTVPTSPPNREECDSFPFNGYYKETTDQQEGIKLQLKQRLNNGLSVRKLKKKKIIQNFPNALTNKVTHKPSVTRIMSGRNNSGQSMRYKHSSVKRSPEQIKIIRGLTNLQNTEGN